MHHLLSFLLLFGISLGISSPLHAQNWLPAGELPPSLNPYVLFHDTAHQRLLIGGTFFEPSSGVDRVFSYDNSGLQLLEKSVEGVKLVTDFLFFEDELLVFGGFDSIGGVYSPRIAKLEGDDFLPAAFGDLSDVSLIAQAMVWQGDLLVVGVFGSINGLDSPGIARWDGTSWHTVAGGLPDYDGNGFLVNLIEYQGQLIVGGNFSNNGEQWDLMKLENGEWKPLPGWVAEDPFSNVTTFEVFEGDLYVGGQFSKSLGNLGNNLLRFDGQEWHELGEGTNFKIWDLMALEDYLLVAGQFQSAGPHLTSNCAIWTGGEWCKAHSSSFQNGSIHSLQFFQDTLFIFGGFDIIDNSSFSGLAKWSAPGPPEPIDCVPLSTTDDSNTALEPSIGLEIFPNPASSYIEVSFSKTPKGPILLEVFDSSGRTLYHQSIDIPVSINRIPLTHLPSGVYYFQITHSEGRMLKKWVKQ